VVLQLLWDLLKLKMGSVELYATLLLEGRRKPWIQM
jgi:hypothetical protein